MGLFRRKPALPPPAPLRLALPRLDGSTWLNAMAQSSFEASTYYEMGSRRSYEPNAHALADRLLDAALPRVSTGASAQDEPYLRKTLLTATRVGAGIGLVDPTASPAQLDPAVAGALGLARRGLPAMQPDWALLGAWFLLAGHWLARQDPDLRDRALQELVEQL